jgi:hypothetical protein
MPQAQAQAQPLGVSLKGRGKDTIGRLLGSGAQASVHAIVDKKGEERDDYVVKVAPLPEKRAAPKKKKSIVELNANSIYREMTLYTTHLRCLQGSILPSAPPVMGKLDQFSHECDGT